MRGCGKTTLLKTQFSSQNALWIDLLLAEQELKYRRNPDILLKELQGLHEAGRQPELVIIDEVQKVPAMLDVVHHCIENMGQVFALTGSSARKLKRGGANLLAGRAYVFHLFPLDCFELSSSFSLDYHLTWGGLPALYPDGVMTDLERRRFLTSYVHTYLREEIASEQLVRNLDPFSMFLEVSAQSNGQIINYSRQAREAGIDDKTVEKYYSILADTHLGFLLPPFHLSVRSQQQGSPRFYYDDTGLVRAIQNRLEIPVTPSCYEYGRLFETFIVGQVHHLNAALEKNYRLFYLRTKDGTELDLIIEKAPDIRYCVEIKSGTVTGPQGFSAQRALARDIPGGSFTVWSSNELPLVDDGFRVLPWRIGLQEVFGI